MQSYTSTGRPLVPRSELLPHEDAAIPNVQPADVKNPPIAGSASSRSRATRKPQAEWDQIKSFFVELYIDRDRSLKDTMQLLLDEHGFSATLGIL